VEPSDPPAPTLALVAAVALCEAVGVFGPPAEIKWPNDLLVAGAKLSGILLERADDAVVIGFGVNLAHHPEGLGRATTSIAALTGAAPDPGTVVEVLAESFARWLGRWRSGGVAAIRAAWMENAHATGTPLSVSLPDGEALQGLFDGLDAAGALRLRLAGGAVRVIHAGDVFLIQD
jgi:BirA family transcriptional regulator, biotin operon repressor / biotin---[acetyl-CoA-carboxylase] ligase